MEGLKIFMPIVTPQELHRFVAAPSSTNKVFDMSKLALVTPEGLILCDNEPPMLEEHQEEPIWVVAAREAERVSTQKKVNE